MNAPLRGWHWPRFDRPIDHHMAERDLLGLPARFTLPRFADSMPQAVQAVRHSSVAQLLAIVASAQAALEHRIAAGNLLGMVGDPRIAPDDPAMLSIDAAEARIGLPADQVAAVHARYRELGVQEQWIRKEAPAHSVALAGYRIARYPVTNGEYSRFLDATGSTAMPAGWQFGMPPLGKANHPVHTLPPHAADAYAAWLAARTQRRFRLPTEAEWEYAAAGPAGCEFPWGEQFVCDVANTAELGLMDTTPVGIFPDGDSPFGLADMAGNVEEYVATDYHPYARGAAVRDHLAELNGCYRVARGGSFARFRDLARTRRRHGWNAQSAVYVMGFRLAEDP